MIPRRFSAYPTSLIIDVDETCPYVARFPGQKTREETSYNDGDALNVEESIVDEDSRGTSW